MRLKYQALICVGGVHLFDVERKHDCGRSMFIDWGKFQIIRGALNITVGQVKLFLWEENLFVGKVTDDHVSVSLAQT